MPRVARIGHVGLHVKDLERSRRFYHEVIGLTVTDEVAETGPVFLSAQPDVEHHELVLLPGRSEGDAQILQQLSFRCDTALDVFDFYQRLKGERVVFDFVASHGNAIGIYFFDPDGNRCEIYWDTGLQAKQPFLVAVDLSRPMADVLREIEASVAEHREAGFVDWDSIERQRHAWAEEKQRA